VGIGSRNDLGIPGIIAAHRLDVGFTPILTPGPENGAHYRKANR
jgi:hypothetical protein